MTDDRPLVDRDHPVICPNCGDAFHMADRGAPPIYCSRMCQVQWYNIRRRDTGGIR